MASHLLPDPGGEVARELIDDIATLTAEVSRLRGVYAEQATDNYCLRGALRWIVDHPDTDEHVSVAAAALAGGR